MTTELPRAVGAPLDAPVRPAVAVAHGSDEHLTLLGAPWHWNLLHGVDRADMLAFGRACMEAERKRLRLLVEAVRTANGEAEDENTFRLLKPGQERAWLALLAGLAGPNVEVTGLRRED